MVKYIKPKKGQLVRTLEKTELPAEGMNVTFAGKAGNYWKRRLNDGDIEIIESPKKTEIKKSKKVEEKKIGANNGY